MSFSHFRTLRRLLSNIAILAVLLNALMPSLSQAMARYASNDSGWTEICSTSGSRWVRVDDSGAVVAQSNTRPTDAPASLHGAACDYCLTHAGSFGLPPVPGWQPPSPSGATPAPAPVAQTHRGTSRDWASPAVRAPPRLA
jgi:hypothetical protein